MPTDSYRKYYEKNRESITAKMRERDAQRRADRTQYLREHPDEVELEREKMRGRYHNWMGNKCKRQMEAWVNDPSVKEEVKAFFRLLLLDEKYKGMKPKALLMISEPLNLNALLLT